MKSWNYSGRYVVTSRGFWKLHDNPDGSETWQIRLGIHYVPNWWHLLGVPIALWLGFR